MKVATVSSWCRASDEGLDDGDDDGDDNLLWKIEVSAERGGKSIFTVIEKENSHLINICISFTFSISPPSPPLPLHAVAGTDFYNGTRRIPPGDISEVHNFIFFKLPQSITVNTANAFFPPTLCWVSGFWFIFSDRSKIRSAVLDRDGLLFFFLICWQWILLFILWGPGTSQPETSDCYWSEDFRTILSWLTVKEERLVKLIGVHPLGTTNLNNYNSSQSTHKSLRCFNLSSKCQPFCGKRRKDGLNEFTKLTWIHHLGTMNLNQNSYRSVPLSFRCFTFEI